MTNELPNCSGCTDPRSEGTHQGHTKQHPCPEGGNPNCGYCFPDGTPQNSMEERFEKAFPHEMVEVFKDPNGILPPKSGVIRMKNILKSFINQELLTQKQAILAIVEGVDTNGYATCYTCGVKKHWKELQCGHFVSRAHNSLRFDPRNTKVQCPGCNIFKSGNLDVYALKLTQEYGNDILLELNREKQKIKQFTAQELKDLLAHYQQKVLMKVHRMQKQKEKTQKKQ